MTVVGMASVPASKPAMREANLPLALSSTASRSRSSFGTKPLASISSRSSRCFSSLRIGSRAKAQRSVGGMAVVVITAMATIMVKRFWLSAPIDRPMVAMMTSVEPRAFMPQPSARDSFQVRPPSLPPAKAPPSLPRLAMRMSATVSSNMVGFARTVRSALRPAVPKKIGMKKAMINPRSCSSIWRVRIGDSPIRMPATKAPSTVCTPIRSVVIAMTHMIRRIAVITAKSLTNVSLTQRMMLNTSRRPTVRLSPMNTIVPITLFARLKAST